MYVKLYGVLCAILNNIEKMNMCVGETIHF